MVQAEDRYGHRPRWDVPGMERPTWAEANRQQGALPWVRRLSCDLDVDTLEGKMGWS